MLPTLFKYANGRDGAGKDEMRREPTQRGNVVGPSVDAACFS